MKLDELVVDNSRAAEPDVTKRIFDAWGEWVHEKTLLAAGIVRASVKDCFDTPTQTLPDHGLHHLQHWQRSPGPREEVLRDVSSSARAVLRSIQESSPCRLRPPSAFRTCSHILLASSSAGAFSPQRRLQRAGAVHAACRTLISQTVLCLVRFMHWQESPVTI